MADSKYPKTPATTGNGNGEEGPNPSVAEVAESQGESADRMAQPVDAEGPPRLPFPVVGIGASAGGLPAFQAFFRAMPADSGIAFVLIQHLPPDRESMTAEILGRATLMPVREVRDGVKVKPDHVYVIRPGHVLTIKNGKLHLGESVAKPGYTRPVDDFFRSLAEEQRERAICIIMSGMGSNGAAGAQAIKAIGGLCIAQDPETAEYPSMPRHLIEAGYADHVLRPEEMPDVLLGYAQHPYTQGRHEADTVLRREQQHFREILAILRTRTRHDFAGYKKPTLLRRIQRRMGLNRVEKMGEYARILRQTPAEVSALSDDMMIHVTGFFRDAQAWETLREKVVAPLVRSREPDTTVRCWVTACSSGEEAYSLAILLVEEAERAQKRLDIKVFATDMAERTLSNARHGIYPGGIESEMPPERLERFFEREDAVYRVRRELREAVIFAPQNLLHDPPFSRLDIVTCRNLLIYLEPDVQRRVLALLHFGLREGGTLFLGTSETIGGMEEFFEPIDRKWRMYRRVGPTRHGALEFPVPHVPGTVADRGAAARAAAERHRPSFAQLTNNVLLEQHTPAAVLVDREQRVVYYHGNTAPFLVQPAGEPTRELLALARQGVRGAVRTALQQAATRGERSSVPDGWVEMEGGGGSDGDGGGAHRRIVVTASPVPYQAYTGFHVVSFEVREEPDPEGGDGSGSTGAGTADRALLNDELRRVRDELQSTIEELQASNEELKASNEEVSSMNEELQSSNEELETSKEEMQSLNEELTTVNAQLQAKMEELQATSNDLGSLLASTNIAVIFLDRHSRIRRFTPAVKALVELMPSDVGRPLSDFARKFTDAELVADTQGVLDRLTPVEREVQAGERTYLRRATPYRTPDNRIDGVVLTFVDITDRKRVEEAMRAAQERLKQAMTISTVGVIFFDLEGGVKEANDAFLRMSGYTREDVRAGRLRWDDMTPPEFMSEARHAMEEFRARGETTPYEKQYIRRDGSRWWGLFSAKRLVGGEGVEFIIDITERKAVDERLRESEERLRTVLGGVRDLAIVMFDAAGRITMWNVGAEDLLGWRQEEVLGQDGAIIFTPEDREAGVPEQELTQAAKAGHASDTRWHLRKDGERIWGNGSVRAVRSTSGVAGFVKVLRDDTSLKVAHETIESAKETAESASRLKDEFLATLSHELRTPLSAILLWSKMLQSKQIPPDQQGEALHAIITSAEAQRELVETLLDTARIQSGKLRLALREVELLPLVRDAIDAILPTANAKDVKLEAGGLEDVGVVVADPDRLRQVVWNLLTNSVKFTPPEGRIRVSLARHGGEVELSVSDTGQGIDPPFLPQLFHRFRQSGVGRASQPGGGLGLGLSISKQLVELHGGTITAHSEGVGKGATFRVRLPMPRVGDTVKAGRTPRVAGGTLKGVSVLLVEDDASTMNALTRLLVMAGAEVTSAASGAAALEAYGRQRPDVIVSDIGMAGMDGYEFMDAIRERESASRRSLTPAVALTALAQEKDRRKAKKHGYQEHISKPPDPHKLVEVVARVVKGK